MLEQVRQSGKKERRGSISLTVVSSSNHQKSIKRKDGAEFMFALLARYMAPFFERDRNGPSRLHPRQKSVVRIFKVCSVTPGGRHYWCESNVGLIRKPVNGIPPGLLREFDPRS